MPQEFYNQEQAEEILRLAAHRDLSGGVTRDALLRMAGEVGLSPEAVAAAEQEYVDRTQDASLERQFAARQRSEYWSKILAYIGTNGMLVGIWWLTGHGFFWPGFIVLFMAIELVESIPAHFMTASGGYRKAFLKWKARRERREAGDSTADEDHRDGIVIGARIGRRRARRRDRNW